ncbi:MAG: hypothetical protein HRT88_01415 [Lentisphaeraceae bacterium]|nr:hypothetical protein [Lentisphaeraceae bacterium]
MKPLRILSIYPGHNSSICILEDEKVLLNWELERFSRIKHDYGFNEAFLKRSLELCDLSINDIDFVCLNRGLNNPYAVRQGTVLRPCEVPDTSKEFTHSFRAKILGREIDALAINHHLAHASGAFYTSPFEESIVLSYDGGGDGENYSQSIGHGNQILRFTTSNAPNLAGWWSSLTFNNYRMPRIHEWDPGSGAGKIMGLAAYGNYDSAIAARLKKDMLENKICNHYFDPSAYAFNDAEDLSDVLHSRSQSLAKVLQDNTEESISKIFEQLYLEFEGIPNLCYAGGLALNCIANSRALNKSRFENLHVPPCPNDTGLAMGMAMYAYYHHMDKPRTADYFSPYTGPIYKNQRDEFNALAIEKGLIVEEVNHQEISNILVDRQIICLYRGRSECGPRALGNRSIICLPDLEGCRDKLNFEVKKREWYRPYAPIILEEHAQDILEPCPNSSPYMTTSSEIKKEWRKRLSGVNHTDNTTRPQILKSNHNSFLYKVLQEVYKRTGIPVLLNTSFNLKEPIVETPKDAVETFMKLPINYLITEDLILRKR